MGTSTTSTRSTFVDSLTTVVSDRHREIGLLVGLLFSAFSMVSLMGFEAGDPTWIHPGDTEVLNPCGPVGALIADALFTGVGHGAWAMFLGMIACVMALAGRLVVQWDRFFLGAMAYVLVLALLHLAFGPGAWFDPGGLLGRYEAEILQVAVGGVGAWLVVLSALLILVTILGNIRWSTVAARLVGHAEKWLPRAGAVVSAGGHTVKGWAHDAGRAGFHSGKRAATGSATRTWRTLRRIGKSFTRREGDYDPDSDYEFDTGLEDLDHDPDTFTPSDEGDDRTAVGLPLAVAEVEWEPTGDLSAIGAASADSSEVLDLFPALTPRSGLSDAASLAGGTIPGSFPGDRDEPTSPSDAPPSMVPSAAVQVPVPSAELAASAAYSHATSPGMAVTPAPPKRHSIKLPTPPQLTPVPEDDELEQEAPVVKVRDRASSVEIRIGEGANSGDRQDNGRAIRKQKRNEFQLPGLKLLNIVPKQHAEFDAEELRRLAQVIEDTLEAFKVRGEVTDVRVGPVVTTFEYLPEPGIKVSKVSSLSDDLSMALKVESCRIEIRSEKGVIGIEIPSPRRMMIYLRELLASEKFAKTKFALPCVIGKDVEGRPVIQDLAKMPHMLVGGTTGSGKSVGVNGMLMSMLYTRTPEELRLLLVDPKILEFKMYEDIPHLIHPVVTEPKKAAAALAWACREMDDRYGLLARWDVRNIAGYNKKVKKELAAGWNAEKARRYCPPDEDPAYYEPVTLPYIVIVIDELADLMMQAKKEVEESIARIAQKARAAGIHLIVATQRPSADVVTGLIKSNLPTRLSFKLKSGLDSRVILDENGAERLLGKGDCLLSPNGSETMRCHGAFVDDDEVFNVVDFLRGQGEPEYIEDITSEGDVGDFGDDELDEHYDAAAEFVREKGKASTSMIQRRFKIGYNRAANIIDQLESRGVVGPADGARPREVIG